MPYTGASLVRSKVKIVVRRQKMHGSPGELAELTVDDIWQIAGAGDLQLQELKQPVFLMPFCDRTL